MSRLVRIWARSRWDIMRVTIAPMPSTLEMLIPVHPGTPVCFDAEIERGALLAEFADGHKERVSPKRLKELLA